MLAISGLGSKHEELVLPRLKLSALRKFYTRALAQKEERVGIGMSSIFVEYVFDWKESSAWVPELRRLDSRNPYWTPSPPLTIAWRGHAQGNPCKVCPMTYPQHRR